MIFLIFMIVNKLDSSVRIPFEIVKGSFKQRQLKANNLTNTLFNNINNSIKDDYSIVTYEQLQKHIKDVLPDKNFKVIVQNLTDEYVGECNGLCEVLYNAKGNIRAISLGLCGIGNTIRSLYLPVFIHEFQHLADDIFHPKYLSRLQSLNKKGLNNTKYEDFYDKYYYCPEFIECKSDKKYALKVIKNKTKKFLRGLNISDKMDFIQDMRYSLITEIEAYKQERAIAKELQSKGIKIKPYITEDYAKEGLFEEKINLLKTLAMEYITKERSKNAGRLNKSKKQHQRNSTK